MNEYENNSLTCLVRCPCHIWRSNSWLVCRRRDIMQLVLENNSFARSPSLTFLRVSHEVPRPRCTSNKYICGSFHCPCATVEARAKFIGLCAHEIDVSFLKRLKQLRQGPGDLVSYKGETYTKINTMLCIRSWSLAESIVQSYSCTALFRQVHKPQGKGWLFPWSIFIPENPSTFSSRSQRHDFAAERWCRMELFRRLLSCWRPIFARRESTDCKLWHIFHDLPSGILDEEQTIQ